MTLLWMDGFEGQDLLSIYEGQTNNPTTVATTRFGYGRAATFSTNRSLTKYVTPSAQVYVGLAWNITLGAPSGQFMDVFTDGVTTQHIRVQWAATGALEIYRGTSTTLLATSTAVIRFSEWNYVEVGVHIDDTVGWVEARINGVTVATYSGDTRNGGTSTDISAIRFTGQNTALLDDYYICNSLGSTNNGFLGDVRVVTLVPTGAGTTTGLTPSAGTNWSNVDELPVGTTDYNYSSVSGTRDTYAMADLPTTPSSIYAVKTALWARKSDTGAMSAKTAMRVNTTTAYGATQVLNTSVSYYFDTFELSPASSAAWTATEVNGMEAGMEVV